MEHRIEILVPHTSDPEAWNQTHELIERVAEETLCHQRRAVSFSIGALMNADIARSAAADLARSANLLVLDCGGISDPETPWPDDVVEHIAALSGTIRKIRPRLLLRATGAAKHGRFAGGLPRRVRGDWRSGGAASRFPSGCGAVGNTAEGGKILKLPEHHAG
ncbi:hypothetical protein VQ056_23740 [Paenibacillus sp. JTLBN-2024]